MTAYWFSMNTTRTLFDFYWLTPVLKKSTKRKNFILFPRRRKRKGERVYKIHEEKRKLKELISWP